MKKHLITAFLMTIVTTILLGVIYPLVITAVAQVLFKDKANGQIRYRNGEAIGSRIIAQPFVSAKYFHSRPSAAGNGYDAANSGGTNYAPTNQKLIDRIRADAGTLHQENPDQPIPVDLTHHLCIGPGSRNFSRGCGISGPAHCSRAGDVRIRNTRPGPKAYLSERSRSLGRTTSQCPGTEPGSGRFGCNASLSPYAGLDAAMFYRFRLTTATLFTPLHARYSCRSGVATMLRTTPPPDGIACVLNFSALGSN